MGITRTLAVSPRLELFFALAAVLAGGQGTGLPEGVRRWLDQARRRLDRGFRRRLDPRARVPAFWARLAAQPLPRAAALGADVDGVIEAVAALPPGCFQPAEDPEALRLLAVDALRRFDRLAFASLWRPWREELAADAFHLEARLAGVSLGTSPRIESAVFLPSRFAPPGFTAPVAEGDAMLLPFDPDRWSLPAAALRRAPRIPAPASPDPALIFRALGDATRYTIAGLIARAPMTSAELARRLAIAKPTMAHHLRVLRGAGLVLEEMQGTRIVLTLDRSVLEGLSDAAVAQFFGAAEAPIQRSRNRASAARGPRR